MDLKYIQRSCCFYKVQSYLRTFLVDDFVYTYVLCMLCTGHSCNSRHLDFCKDRTSIKATWKGVYKKALNALRRRVRLRCLLILSVSPALVQSYTYQYLQQERIFSSLCLLTNICFNKITLTNISSLYIISIYQYKHENKNMFTHLSKEVN